MAINLTEADNHNRSGYKVFKLSYEGNFSGFEISLLKHLHNKFSFFGFNKNRTHEVCSIEHNSEVHQNLIKIHSYMLENGEYTLEVKPNNSNEGLKGSIQFSVFNESKLSKDIGLGLIEAAVPIIVASPLTADLYPYEEMSLKPWFERPDALNVLHSKKSTGVVSEKEFNLIKNFIEQGFLIIEDAISESDIAECNNAIDQAVASGYQGFKLGSSKRMELLHHEHKCFSNLMHSESFLSILGKIFDDKAIPCQSLVFVNGSQQPAHQDTIHLTPFPHGYMAGVWIALQDIQQDSGELVIYPGSHKENRIRKKGERIKNGNYTPMENYTKFYDDIASKYEKVTYKPSKGTVLIWHENLLHGGSLRKDKTIERRSCVVHCFSANTVAYYDATGLPATTLK